eukprot:92606-Chlamydomonas_euryale.AAC.4
MACGGPVARSTKCARTCLHTPRRATPPNMPSPPSANAGGCGRKRPSSLPAPSRVPERGRQTQRRVSKEVWRPAAPHDASTVPGRSRHKSCDIRQEYGPIAMGEAKKMWSSTSTAGRRSAAPTQPPTAPTGRCPAATTRTHEPLSGPHVIGPLASEFFCQGCGGVRKEGCGGVGKEGLGFSCCKKYALVEEDAHM